MPYDYYCIYCLQHKETKHFSEWLEDKSQSRKCNCCNEDKKIGDILHNNEIERNLKRESEKAKVTPILMQYSDSEISKRKQAIRKRADDLAQKMAADEFEL